MAWSIHNPPASLKPVSHYLKVAVEHDTRDQVIAYWARFAAVQKSLTIDKSSPEAKAFVIGLLDWLETKKKALGNNEAVTIEAAGEAHIENYALKLFTWADQSDRAATFNKNVVKAFYTSGILFDILESLRPPLSDEFASARKYAKWKAAYIHNCLKNGETPIPGEGASGAEDDDEEAHEEAHDNEGHAHPGGGPGIGFSGSTNPAASSSHSQNQWFGGGSAADQSQPQQPDDHNNLYNMGGGVPGGYGHPQGGPPPAGGCQPPPNYGCNPGMPYSSGVTVPTTTTTPGAAVPAGNLSVEQIAKAQKYCKWAGSALNFDDVASAVDNLEKALHLLKTGQDVG